MFLFLVGGGCLDSLAQDLPFHVRVKLALVADTPLRDEAMSILTRELRSLSGVTVVDDTPEWQLGVVVRQLTLGSDNEAAGVAVAFYSGAVTDGEMLESLVGDSGSSIPPKAWKTLHEQVDGTLNLRQFNLLAGPPDNLRAMLQKVVAAFDARDLEPERRFWQKLADEGERK